MAAVGTGTATGLGTTTVPTTSMPTPLPTPVATSQPVGSSVFLALALTTLSLLVLLLLRHYLPLRSTPAFLLVPVFFAIFLPASLVLLVPIDLGSTLAYIHASHGTTISPRHLAEGGAAPPPHVHHNSAVWLPERAVLVMWRIAYWLIFALTWLILPFLSEYLDAYHPTGRARALASLRANARYYLSLLALGCAGLAYVAVSYGLRPASLRSLVMALAYVWGLALAIYLMGHGLVAVPRHCWRKRSYPAHLRRLQTRAVSVWDQLVDSRTDCAEIERVVALVAERKGSVVSVGDSQVDLAAWIDELARDASYHAGELESGRGGAGGGHQMTGIETALFPPAAVEQLRAKIPTVLTEGYLASLTRRLHRARHRHARFVSEWTRLVQEAVDTQAIIDSAAKGALEFGPRIRDQVGLAASPTTGTTSLPSMPSRRWQRKLDIAISPRLRYHLYIHVLPPARMLVAAVLAVASACIVLSEVFKSVFPPLSLVSLSIFPRSPSSPASPSSVPYGYTFTFPQQLTTAAWLLYMSLCATWTLHTTPLTWRQRALVPRNTHGESAAWYAGQLARLTVPMAYNFVTLLPAQVRKGTVFYAFLGRWVDFTALGKGVDALLPACILLPVFLGLFDVYGKVARSLGFAVGDSEGYSDAEGPGVAEDGSSGFISTWTEGRQLIEQELNGPGALGLSSQYRDSVASARYKSSRGEGARGDVAARAGGLLPSSSSLSLLNATPAGADSSANAGARAGTAESTSAASSPRSRTFLSSAPNFLPFSATSNARPRSSHAFDRDRAGGVSSNIADTTLNATQRHGHRDGNDDGNDDDDSSNPIMAFAHRVRNTVETVSWPWQQQQQQHSHRRQESRAQNNMNQGPGSVWDRLFGGDAAAGGIRL